MEQLPNFCSKGLGAKLVDHSSQVQGCEASNVLTGPLDQLWLSEDGLPQWLCISLAELARRRDGSECGGDTESADMCIRTVGWHCWHPYSTNPREVTLHVSADGSKFKVWDTFSCSEPAAGRHLFCCAPINIGIYSFIAIEVTQAFGGSQTYMNRLYFFPEEVPSARHSSGHGLLAPSEAVHLNRQQQEPTPPHSYQSTDNTDRAPSPSPASTLPTHTSDQLPSYDDSREQQQQQVVAQLAESANAVNAELLEAIDRKLNKIMSTCDQLEMTVHTDYLLKADAAAAGGGYKASNSKAHKKNINNIAPSSSSSSSSSSSVAAAAVSSLPTAKKATEQVQRDKGGTPAVPTFDSSSLRGLATSISRQLEGVETAAAASAAEEAEGRAPRPSPSLHLQQRTDELVSRLRALVREKAHKKAQINVLTRRLT